MHTLARILLVAALVALAPRPGARAAAVPDDAAAVEHALGRLTYGARPGDVDRVRAAGLAGWIDSQLDPARLDDSALAAWLPPLPALPAGITEQREALRFGRSAVQALAAQKALRAVHSERQLEEVLVDFWFNHFNVFAGKGRTALYLVDYEQSAIRPHIWGSFRDLLGATAKSPAMLFYLDNWMSASPQAPAAAAGRRRGLNENYARELLELHTLGVDGGYTQEDIVNVARAFTGWTIASPLEGRFRFMPALHDRTQKVVLGRTLQPGGIDQGERVLDLLAGHPATARHIATKLARRFVSDNPPEPLVARVAARFLATGGNLREVVRAVVTSDEFFADAARGAKTKTPLEFVVSAVRATGRPVRDAQPIVTALRQLGMPPYMCQPPTGYDEAPESWVSAGALIARMNIAQQVAPAQAARLGGPDFQRR